MAHPAICDARYQLLSKFNRLLIRQCNLMSDLSATAAVQRVEFRKLAALSTERKGEIDDVRQQLENHCREHGCGQSTTL